MKKQSGLYEFDALTAFVGRQSPVLAGYDRSEPCSGKMYLDVSNGVFGEDRNPITLPHALSQKASRNRIHPLESFGIGEL
jgi:hypothetical protein